MYNPLSYFVNPYAYLIQTFCPAPNGSGGIFHVVLIITISSRLHVWQILEAVRLGFSLYQTCFLAASISFDSPLIQFSQFSFWLASWLLTFRRRLKHRHMSSRPFFGSYFVNHIFICTLIKQPLLLQSTRGQVLPCLEQYIIWPARWTTLAVWVVLHISNALLPLFHWTWLSGDTWKFICCLRNERQAHQLLDKRPKTDIFSSEVSYLANGHFICF